MKVIGDFCRWNDRLVFGCDDAAQNEFLNTRKAKGKVAGPARSQSNLWFVEPQRIDQLGPAMGRGAVWLDEPVKRGEPSDAFLFGGFTQRSVHLAHQAETPMTFRFEMDHHGDGIWTLLQEITVPAAGYMWHAFDAKYEAEWIRITANSDCRATAWFEYRNADSRPSLRNQESQLLAGDFAGLARAGQHEVLGGLVRAGDRGVGLKILATRLEGVSSEEVGYYELKPDLSLVRVESDQDRQQMAREVAIPTGILRLDGNSILYIDDDSSRDMRQITNIS